jgi:hypothetical protein
VRLRQQRAFGTAIQPQPQPVLSDLPDDVGDRSRLFLADGREHRQAASRRRAGCRQAFGLRQPKVFDAGASVAPDRLCHLEPKAAWRLGERRPNASHRSFIGIAAKSLH